MSIPNIGWLYFKDYLRINGNPVLLFNDANRLPEEQRKDFFEQHFNNKNEVILGSQFAASTSTQLQIGPSNQKLKFKTIYPGLTMGTGYTHETGEMGEFKLGFFFDYATGYPCIPGSTVKGCLRSMFPQNERKDVADKLEKYNYLASVIRNIPELSKSIIKENDLEEKFDQELTNNREQFIDFLEREIFDGERPVINEDGSYKIEKEKFIYQSLCTYSRDIFYDGYIDSTDHPSINNSAYQNLKPFIAEDYITPHLNRKKPELSSFTNPVPLMFLKILPEVKIQFQFDLKNGILQKQEKEEIFRRILLDFGIGAKTNVGYGQFDEMIVDATSPASIDPREIPVPENIIPAIIIPSLRRNAAFQGEVLDRIGLYNIYTFKIGQAECRLKKQYDKNPDLKKGDKVTILFKLDYQNGTPNFQVK